MNSGIEGRKLPVIQISRRDNGHAYRVPFPGENLSLPPFQNEKLQQRVLKEGFCVIHHPALPAVGVVASVKELRSASVLLLDFNCLRRVQLVTFEFQDGITLAETSKFEEVGITAADFKKKEFAEFLSHLKDLILATMGPKKSAQGVDGPLLPSARNSGEFSSFLDSAARMLSDFPDHPIILMHLLHILAEEEIRLRAEVLYSLHSWIREKRQAGETIVPVSTAGYVPVVIGNDKANEAGPTDDDWEGDANLPLHVQKIVQRELQRLKGSSKEKATAEDQTIRNYVYHLRVFPWNAKTVDQREFGAVKTVLDNDHYGLNDVKSEILEFLAVRQLNPDAKSKILCLAGPPGTGKSSLGRSIARSLGRKFFRLSLGGLHDEAILRGHRRTYIGSMPGKIVKNLELVGVRNPVVLLDEVDKVDDGHGRHNPIESALLEILDPEQNDKFEDHYLDTPVDLSDILFVCTANSKSAIHKALLDRMHVIDLPGYSEFEKLHIARDHVVPKEMLECGLRKDGESLLDLEITDDALLEIIRKYTSEAGVRKLEEKINCILRKHARMFCEKTLSVPSGETLVIKPNGVKKYLGNPPTEDETRDLGSLPAGTVPMLTVAGGEGGVGLIEVSSRPNDKFDRTITGNLHTSISESIKVATSRLWHGDLLPEKTRDQIGKKFFHIHVDEGGVEKDGPSAGVMFFLAMASSLLNKPIKPFFVGTGEITLNRNAVLPIGGVREKLLAAIRLGFREIFVPAANALDLEKLPAEIRANMLVIRPKTEKSLKAASIRPENGVIVYCIDTPEEAFEIAFSESLPEIFPVAEEEGREEDPFELDMPQL